MTPAPPVAHGRYKKPGNYVKDVHLIIKIIRYCSRARGHLRVEIANIVIATPVALGVTVVELDALRSAIKQH